MLLTDITSYLEGREEVKHLKARKKEDDQMKGLEMRKAALQTYTKSCKSLIVTPVLRTTAFVYD